MLRKDRHGTQEEQGAWSRIVAVIYGDNAAGKSAIEPAQMHEFSPISYAIVLFLREALAIQLFLLDRESAK